MTTNNDSTIAILERVAGCVGHLIADFARVRVSTLNLKLKILLSQTRLYSKQTWRHT